MLKDIYKYIKIRCLKMWHYLYVKELWRYVKEVFMWMVYGPHWNNMVNTESHPLIKIRFCSLNAYVISSCWSNSQTFHIHILCVGGLGLSHLLVLVQRPSGLLTCFQRPVFWGHAHETKAAQNRELLFLNWRISTTCQWNPTILRFCDFCEVILSTDVTQQTPPRIKT